MSFLSPPAPGARPAAPPATRLVFFNPAAGSAWQARRVRRAVEALASVPGTAVHETRPGAMAAQVRALLTGAVTRMYVAGGDGTVGEMAGALVDAPVALGIIPTGTTNVLAREFGIPLDPRRAAGALEASGRTLALRAWHAGAHLAVLGAGVGWDAQVMARSSQAFKRRAGRAGIGLLGLREIMRYDFPPLVVTGTDEQGRAVTLRGSSVLFASVKRWAGGNLGFPQADPCDDVIDVVALESHSRLHLLAFWTLMVTPGGRPLRLPRVRSARLVRAHVACEEGRPIPAHVNGDPVLGTPFDLEPAGLVRVVVP